jgi:pimeloyl-ACP methyl ester carboxylesterase
MGGMVAARYGLKHPHARGVVNVDGHGLGGPSVPQAFHDERARLMSIPSPAQPSDRGDDTWLAAELDAMRPAVEALGLDWEEAEPAVRRSYARTGDGGWIRRPSNAFIAAFPNDMGPELFDIYRSVECPLLVFNCTKKQAAPFSPELAAAYRDSLTTDLEAVQRERSNVEIHAMPNGHMVLLEDPAATAERLLRFMREHR